VCWRPFIGDTVGASTYDSPVTRRRLYVVVAAAAGIVAYLLGATPVWSLVIGGR